MCLNRVRRRYPSPVKQTILVFVLFVTALSASDAEKKAPRPGPRDYESGPNEVFYGPMSGKRVVLDALVWYDTWGIPGRVVLPSGTSVYIKDPSIELKLPGRKFPKIEPRLPKGRLVRLVGVLTIENYEPPRPYPPGVQGYSYAFSYLALALESFSVVERAKLQYPELHPK